ncbi:MAG: NIPSNAP family protein, partial [Flavitalea sp.]
MKLRFVLLSVLLLTMFIMAVPFTGRCLPPEKEYYEIRVYELANKDQETKLDTYFKDALLPGLHRLGISKIGVFKHRENDSASMSKVFLLIPYKSLQQFETSAKKLEDDKAYQSAGAEYLNAPFDNPPYQRLQKTLSRALWLST